MAPIHNIIHRGNWSDALKRALGVTKSDGGVERFGETLQPIVNLWGLPEWAHIRGEYLGVDSLSQAAVAAEFSMVAWGLPVASQSILIVDRVNVRSTGVLMAFSIGIAPRSVVAATLTLQAGAPTNRDQRFQPLPTAVLRALPIERFAGSDPGNTLGGNSEEGLAAAAQNYLEFISPPFIVKPGGCLYIAAATVNIGMVSNMACRVRQALPGELSL